MIQHTLIHAPNRPKEKLCEVCGQLFYRTADLNRHLKTHDERGQWVAKCGRIFSRGDAIERHRRKTKCGICKMGDGYGKTASSNV